MTIAGIQARTCLLLSVLPIAGDVRPRMLVRNGLRERTIQGDPSPLSAPRSPFVPQAKRQSSGQPLGGGTELATSRYACQPLPVLRKRMRYVSRNATALSEPSDV